MQNFLTTHELHRRTQCISDRPAQQASEELSFRNAAPPCSCHSPRGGICVYHFAIPFSQKYSLPTLPIPQVSADGISLRALSEWRTARQPLRAELEDSAVHRGSG